jgi:DNA-binding NtrC family response regulator
VNRRLVLLVDDDDGIVRPVQSFLLTHGFEVASARGVSAALERSRASRPDVVVVDFRLPDGDGLALLKELKASHPTLPVIMLTGHATIGLAVQAIKEGAENVLTKPVELPALRVVIDRVLETQRLRHLSAAGRLSRSRAAEDPFLGVSPAMKRLADLAERVAGSPLPALIVGETGSGKGVLARWLHDHGPRSDDAFVDLNCAGFSRELLDSELFGHEKGAFTGAVAAKQGLLEAADHGTLFLDEIGEMPADIQPKLLKVIEERRFRRVGDTRERFADVRLISATHRDLPLLVQEGRFRDDLLHRIQTLPLRVPPLRERPEDVRLLARAILERMTRERGRRLEISPEAEALLVSWRWPGNVRELRNVLERAALLASGDRLDADDLRDCLGGLSVSQPPPALMTLKEAEKQHIEAVLRHERYAVARTAEVLGMSRTALYDRIRKLGIALPRARAQAPVAERGE